MASARGRKKTTQQRRRSQKKRKPQRGRRQKSRGRRQKSHGRRSPAKQRKHRRQTKRQPVATQRKRALKCSSRSINAKMLSQTKRGGQFLSHQAKWLMTSFMEDIYKQVSSEAERLRRKSHDPLISPMHVQAALKRVVPKRRWRHVPRVVSRNRH